MIELKKLINVNITGSRRLITPKAITELVPASKTALANVLKSRQVIENILDEKDPRLFFVIGPCSIHDPKAALEYAEKLKKLSDRVADRFFMIMRVYFEKPRTTTGWKGLINDPNLDDSFHIEEGLKLARRLLLQFTELGLAAGTEALDPITPQYLAEFITWAAIGARTAESQTHRELASGLSMPVGFKNGTDGSIQTAVNALKAATTSHHFLGIDAEGKICKFSTRGNKYCHIVLRGGGGRPNYDRPSISACEAALDKNGLRKKIVVDYSHDNSNKDHRLQPKVLADCVDQIREGNKSICGFMMESNLFEGNQPIPNDLKQLKYGVSVTDQCLSWATTEKVILEAYEKLR
ncbi:MAG: 3-deoxy-7-phosphoheptulonate synthase [Deltaproteobacteria bacterium]|nr:3-deoxy-7-phosphoheptulonate synthase [Deltaproteobacteria bacterium]